MKHCRIGDLVELRREPGIAGLPTLAVTLDRGLIDRNILDREHKSALLPEEHLLVRTGDLVYNTMRMWQGALGIAQHDGVVSPSYVVCRVKDGVSPKYLGYLLKLPASIRKLRNFSHGLTGDRLRLYFQEFAKVPVEVPTYEEQRQIAQVLETWDDSIATLERLIEAKRERKRGLMQLLLTGKKRFTEYAHLAWRSAPLADYVASARKGKPASLNDSGRGVPYIGSAAFDGDYTSHTDDPSAVRCSAKDVLLLWDGEYAGKSTTGHVGAVGSTVVAITLKPGLDHVYLHNLLLFHNQRIRSIREGSGIPHMPSDFFTWFKPHLPPIEEQRTIASVLSTADEELRMLEAQLEAYKLQKRGLMQQLLTGKKRINVDVSEAVPA